MWESLTAQEFIRRLLDVNPTTRMSLTDALNHPWLSSAAASGSGDATHEPANSQYEVHRSLSDVSELSELPDDDEHAGVNGDASMLSAAPSSDDMLGVHSLQINSPQRTRPPLERRSKVLARELEAEAEAHAATSPAASSPQSGVGKRQRSENDAGGSPAVDVAMTGGESGGDSDGGAAAMDVVEPMPPAAKRGRRSNQDRQSASASPPTAVGNGNGNGNGNNGQGRVLRSRVAAPAGSGRR